MAEMVLLTDDEIILITEYSRKADQCRELCRLGIPYQRSRTGKPLVLREAAAKRIGGGRVGSERFIAPDLEALRAVS